jgi:hypothetical protein
MASEGRLSTSGKLHVKQFNGSEDQMQRAFSNRKRLGMDN